MANKKISLDNLIIFLNEIRKEIRNKYSLIGHKHPEYDILKDEINALKKEIEDLKNNTPNTDNDPEFDGELYTKGFSEYITDKNGVVIVVKTGVKTQNLVYDNTGQKILDKNNEELISR